MAEDEEQGKRRRGRRRSAREKASEAQPTPESQPPETGAPAGNVVPSIGSSEPAAPKKERTARTGAGTSRRTSGAGGSSDVNPMDFWRSGRPRSFKTEAPLPGGKKPGLMHRLRNIYFPPWLPVAVIILAVFGILGLLFITRSATGAPRIGQDHWHAAYTYYNCGEKQPNAPTWESGVHTHADGIMHIHPFQSFEEGAGSRMVKWFEYGGGELSQDSIRLPGTSVTWENGDTCAEGTPDAGKTGVVQVFVNSTKLDNWSRFIPHDGDQIKILFAPEAAIVQLDDRQVIAESEATRTIEIAITGEEGATKFTPSAPTMTAGETVKFLVHNQTTLSHQFRVNGADAKQGTGDDFVAVPVGSDPTKADLGDIIQPGQDGFTIVRFDNAGQFQFQDPISDTGVITTGTIIVEGASSSTPTPGPGVKADVTADMTMDDTGYSPDQITLEAAGKVFGINLTNDGRFVHNLRIAGNDKQFGTEDDIVSADIAPCSATATPTPTATPAASDTGSATAAASATATPAVTCGTGQVTGKIDDPGTYQYRDDFHKTEITGTIVIE